MTSCLVLFSGGLDSTTALHWALGRYGDVRAVTFDYGQSHRIEIRAARAAARRLGVPHAVLAVDLTRIGGSALTDPGIPLPRYSRVPRLRTAEPPATYVPFRNGVFLALAAAWAESRGVTELIVGFNILDSPAYPDTRKPFVRAMERAINAGTGTGGASRIRIRAPFLDMRKSAIIRLGMRLGADYSRSITCYAGEERPCGTCSACLLRSRAFREAGLEDPLVRKHRQGGRR